MDNLFPNLLISSLNIDFFLYCKKGFFPNSFAGSSVYLPTPRENTRMALGIVLRQRNILKVVDHATELKKNTK